MKKYFASVIALLLVALLVSCGADASTETASSEKNVTETTAEPVTLPETDPPETEPETTAPATVTEPETTEPPVVRVSSLSLDRLTVELTVGESEMPWVTMLPEDAADKTELWSSDNEAVASVNYYGLITGVGEGTCTVTVKSADNEEATSSVTVTVKAPETEKETETTAAPAPKPTESAEPTYIDGVLVVNKTYRLPETYNPGVDPTARAALDEMFAAASNEGLFYWIVSDFRSYDFQIEVYGNYCAENGKDVADTFSARPGHSEHQTGLAFDLNSCYQSFGDTPEGQWLAANSWKYGFIIRYPAGKEAVTGFIYEPWHVRYLGRDAAKKVYDSGLCLEEYFGITSEYNY
ncbi:MAG: D-alanyl-D-alanine carboxypeptidase family protein [Clostridia bacterium]|nr:D-alanyl-D-alanine carboxypeptidase family protein [Clostridia bacterium]